jgi:hypothetical protein
MNFIMPGLPLTDDSADGDVLTIILTRNARLIGPAIQNGQVGNMMYLPGDRVLFRYLGQIDYRFSDPGRWLRMARKAHV